MLLEIPYPHPAPPTYPRNLKNYFTGHRTANTIQLFVPIFLQLFICLQSKENSLEATWEI